MPSARVYCGVSLVGTNLEIHLVIGENPESDSESALVFRLLGL